MINNDILRRIRNTFALTDKQIVAVSALSGSDITEEKLSCFFKEKDDAAYIQLTDEALASFLNGFITEKRGPSDGPVRANEQQLSNNMIFNKLKIALALKADEVMTILELAEVGLGKYELSAFFRNVNHKHYRECSDDVLSAFLKGLQLQAS